MADRCVFASFQYAYLTRFKELSEAAAVLYNTTSGRTDLPMEFPADYYGLYTESITAATVAAIHQAGGQAFVWPADTPEQIRNVKAMGVDGICTNRPGLARVVIQTEYQYLTRNYENPFTVPGLYDVGHTGGDMVVQGFTKAGKQLVISAYSYSGAQNSILYILDRNGTLQKTVDLGFAAHVGGIAYDEMHDLLWVTGPEGTVYALSWAAILGDTWQGEISAGFDDGLLNHNQEKVASFLTMHRGELYVGAYVDGANGVLNRYDLTDVQNPALVSYVTIPERIQGVTFWEDVSAGKCNMLLSQSYQNEDSRLLRFAYRDEVAAYEEPLEIQVLPEAAAQIQMTAEGLYILFESAMRPYRETAGGLNDQIYVIRFS